MNTSIVCKHSSQGKAADGIGRLRLYGTIRCGAAQTSRPIMFTKRIRASVNTNMRHRMSAS